MKKIKIVFAFLILTMTASSAYAEPSLTQTAEEREPSPVENLREAFGRLAKDHA